MPYYLTHPEERLAEGPVFPHNTSFFQYHISTAIGTINQSIGGLTLLRCIRPTVITFHTFQLSLTLCPITMWSLAVSSLFWLAFRLNVVASAVLEDGAQSLSACPDVSNAVYDYVIIGSGAGGGPLAARLAESGFSGASLLLLRVALMTVIMDLSSRC
jgi:hypothetical protein